MMLVYTLLFVAFLAVLPKILNKMRPRVSTQNLDGFQHKHGLKLDYNYRNVLGIDLTSRKIYIYTDAARIFTVDQIKKIEYSDRSTASSFLIHTKRYSNCSLTIITNDLDQPVYVVEFNGDQEELARWYARLGTFCNM